MSRSSGWPAIHTPQPNFPSVLKHRGHRQRAMSRIFLSTRSMRMDVPNRMFRVAQWTFLFTAITLVLVSYYVHSRRVKPPAITEPAKTRGKSGGLKNL